MFDIEILTIAFVILYFLTSWILLSRINKKRKAKKNLLVLQFGPGHITSTVFIYQVLLISSDLHFSPVVFTILATVGILVEIVSFQLYSKVREDAARMYPEAFAG